MDAAGISHDLMVKHNQSLLEELVHAQLDAGCWQLRALLCCFISLLWPGAPHTIISAARPRLGMAGRCQG